MRRALDLEQPRVLRLLVGLHVRVGERVLHDEIEEALVRRDRHRLDAAVDRALGEDRRQRALDVVARAGELAFGALRHVPHDHAAVGGEMRDRGAVLLADPERAVGEPHDAFGVDAVEVARQRLAACRPWRSRSAAVLSGLSRPLSGRPSRSLSVITSVTRKVPSSMQHHAIDRRRVGRRRVDAAVLHALAGREVDARRSPSSRCRRCWGRGRRPSRSRSADRSGRARRRCRCRR